MKLSIIADPDTVTAFRLAGTSEAHEVHGAEEASDVLSKLSERDDIGIIILTERLADEIRDMIDEVESKKEGVAPIIVEIPDRSGKIERKTDPIADLVKRSVGIEIK